MIGTRVGSYKITKQLGQGGMGAVYLAEHARIGSRKVVKVLLPEYSQNEQIVRRFENEAHAAARLNHRNIIKIDDYGRLENGQWYILMPFLEGSSLEDFLNSHGKLSIHDALHILAQISSALHEAHRLGIVHRDLKPGNVFLTQVGDNARFAMLLDFGIAKVRGIVDGPETQTGAVFGTPAYMAAEQFEDASRADARSDLFALGVIAYQMVTGVLPFGIAAGPVLYNRQSTSRPEPPAGVPKAWAKTLLQTLSLQPDLRPASARAFAIALASATPEEPPFEPSGAEILAVVARELVTQAPAEEATVKNNASADRVAPMLWGSAKAGRSDVPAPSRPPAADGVAAPKPTVVARPGGAPVQRSDSSAANVTTLSVLAGTHVPPAPARSRPLRWQRLGGASVALLGMVVSAGWLLRGRPGESSLAAPGTVSPAPTPAAMSGSDAAPGEGIAGTAAASVPVPPPLAADPPNGSAIARDGAGGPTLRLERLPQPAKEPGASEKTRRLPMDDVDDGT